MPSLPSCTVTVPATTANLGPGFDCLGAALSLYNRFEFSLLPTAEQPVLIQATGLEAEKVTLDGSNLAYRAFAYFYEQMGQTPPPVHLAIALEVPLSRGLGSSATAIVGGLVGANALAGSPVAQERVMEMAIALEGHPDNVVPALLGGCRLSASDPESAWTICEVPWHPDIVPVIAIPNFELSTAEARRVLPQTYSRADAIFNMAHLGLLLRGLDSGNGDWLRAALQDRIHQPYRLPLIRGHEAVWEGAIAAGAYGVVMSGAGPTLMALSPKSQAETVRTAMAMAWAAQGVSVQTRMLQLDMNGAVVLP
jgi:homoserine kinase